MSIIDDIQKIPEDLLQHGQFCCWAYQARPGSAKPAKVPYNPSTGQRARVDHPEDFAPLDGTMTAFQSGSYSGIGILITGNLCAIDIDNCIDDNGQLSLMAADVVNRMQAYTEISPSGRGLRILFVINQPVDKDMYYVNNPDIHMEIYTDSTKKYVTLTGNTIVPAQLEWRSPQLQIVLDKYMRRPKPLPKPVPAPPNTDGETIRLPQPAPPPTQAPNAPEQLERLAQLVVYKATAARNGSEFTALMNGDTTAYKGDESAADLAFCNKLAFWTQKNPALMDYIFRKSRLFRDKWDRPTGGSTYGAITIQHAIDGTEKVYSGNIALTPMGIAIEPPSAPLMDIISATDLQKAVLPPVVYLVDRILAVGTTILAAAPKMGKSWLALSLALCLSAGKKFLSQPTTRCGVLYLALEDSKTRLQDRMNKVLHGASPPGQFYLTTASPTLDTGLLDTLGAQLERNPEIKLIIIDTLQKVRGQPLPREQPYATDYRELGMLKAFADSHGISLLIIHHTRKAKDDDPNNMISGTNGVMGAVDTAWVMIKDKRSDDNAVLSITGRDVEQDELLLTMDKDTMTWGIAADPNVYDNSLIVQAIKEVLAASELQIWKGSASELMQAGEQLLGRPIANSPQQVNKALDRLTGRLAEEDGIFHKIVLVNGGGAKKHLFCYLPEQEEKASATAIADA
nr:AAA family ATPase [uncultured Acetatifactor sp.]